METSDRRRFEETAQSLVGLRLVAVRYVEIAYDAVADDPPPSPRPYYDWQLQFDSLDFGLELVGDDGRVVALVTAQADRWSFGLWIDEGGLPTGDAAVWDVSETSRWSSLLGRQVTEAEVKWFDEEGQTLEMRHLIGRVSTRLMARSLMSAANEPVFPDEDAAEARRKRRFPEAALGRGLMRLNFWLARRRGKVDTFRTVFPLCLVLAFGDQQIWIAAVEVRGDFPIRGTDHVTVAFDEEVAREYQLLP